MSTLIKSSTILLFIDSALENYQTLIDGVIPETEVIVLHPAEDGIKQIATTLKGRSDVASVHIVSHGEPGCLLLGNTRLSLDNLKDYAQDLKNWFSSSLFLYGCSVAAGEVGIAFVRQLQQLTGANIAASTTPTGSKELGGDWNLDVTTSKIETEVIFSHEVRETFQGLLQTPDPNWETNNSITLTEDCFGTTSYTVAESGDGCQSYLADLYENWDTGVGGHGDTDIVSFTTSYDSNFFYFKWDLRENWNYDSSGESKGYEIDIDADYALTGGDSLSDYLVIYLPQIGHVGNTWLAEGGSKVQMFQDLNNDLGGPNPAAPDNPNNQDGIETDVILNSDDVYVRIIEGALNSEGKETGQFIELALDKTFIGSPTDIRARGWATQTSGLDKGKHFWHDENTTTDLASNRQDNTAGADTADWTVLGPSAEVPFEFSPSLGLAIVVGIVGINRLWRKLK